MPIEALLPGDRQDGGQRRRAAGFRAAAGNSRRIGGSRSPVLDLCRLQ